MFKEQMPNINPGQNPKPAEEKKPEDLQLKEIQDTDAPEFIKKIVKEGQEKRVGNLSQKAAEESQPKGLESSEQEVQQIEALRDFEKPLKKEKKPTHKEILKGIKEGTIDSGDSVPAPESLVDRLEDLKEAKEAYDALNKKNHELGLGDISKDRPEYKRLKLREKIVASSLGGFGEYLKDPEAAVKPEDLESGGKAKEFLEDADWSRIVELSKPWHQREETKKKTKKFLKGAGIGLGVAGAGLGIYFGLMMWWAISLGAILPMWAGGKLVKELYKGMKTAK